MLPWQQIEDWIEKMKKSNQLIMGIGHRIKSLANPDQRVGAPHHQHLRNFESILSKEGPSLQSTCQVEIIKGFAKKHFNNTPVLDYALAVEA